MNGRVATFGTCEASGKIKYESRRDAKYVIRKRAWTGKSAFSCDCGYFHIGGKHGILDRSAHRALHGDEGPEQEAEHHMPIEAAAGSLGVTPDFLRRVISDTEWARGTDTHIHAADVARLREMTWRTA